MAAGDDPRGIGTETWAALTAAAYDRHVEYMLRDAAAWSQMWANATPTPISRRRKARYAVSGWWSNVRYRIAKSIYDFPEDCC